MKLGSKATFAWATIPTSQQFEIARFRGCDLYQYSRLESGKGGTSVNMQFLRIVYSNIFCKLISLKYTAYVFPVRSALQLNFQI